MAHIESICIMSCKCRIHMNDLVEIDNKQTCPKHPEGRIVLREFVCKCCGKSFTASKQTSGALYCAVCRKEKTRERNRKSWANNYGKNAKKKKTAIDYEEASVEMAFCKKRSECAGKYTGNYIPCLDCEHYKDPNMIHSL